MEIKISGANLLLILMLLFTISGFAEEIPDQDLIWKLLDKEIASMDRMLTEKRGQALSGEGAGTDMSFESNELELFQEQCGLLKAIRDSGNLTIARQYLLVWATMSENQASHTLMKMGPGDSRAPVLKERIKHFRGIYERLKKMEIRK